MLGVSEPFLSQIQAAKRPLLEVLKRKVDAPCAYHLLITDKQSPKADNGGNDWVRTSDLALMKRPLYR